MTASSCVITEDGTDEIPPSPALAVPPPCLAHLAEPWLRAHYYGHSELRRIRRVLLLECAFTGHTQCALELWREGLPPGADRYAWDGDMK